jgi:purine-binding chemotaxis protein CheW
VILDNLRGLIIPIINLKLLLNFEDSNVATSQKVAIVDHEGAKVGLLFDSTNEIIKVPTIQSSSVDNDICIGIVNLRGQTVPVIDLSMLLKLNVDSKIKIEDRRIIILKIENELFGLIVDGVDSINTYIVDDIMPVPLLSKSRSNMFLGCLSLENLGEVFILNYNEILTNTEILEITHGHSRIYSSNHEGTIKNNKQVNRQAYISFKLDHLFGVSIKDIREIINVTDDIVSAPGMPTFVKGILNLRGKLITIIDTRALYAMDTKNDSSPLSKILIFDVGEERFGLIVDSVESIVTVDEDKKMKVPSLMVKNVQEQFDKDIKEIISFKQNDDKESILVILNMEPVSHRIKQTIAA